MKSNMRVISLTSTIFSIFAVLTVFAMGSSEQAFAQFVPSETYFLTGNGFTITENELDGSTIGLTFSPQDTARTANMNIKEGFLIFQDREYDLDGISGSLLRDGKFLRILGTAQDNQGNEISIRIFGRLVGASDVGFVYQLTGKLDQGNERFSFHYVTKSAIESTPSSEIIKKDDEIITKPVEQKPVAQEPDIEIVLDADYFNRVVNRSFFRFNVNVFEILPNGQQNMNSLPDAKVTADIYDSINNHRQHYQGTTTSRGFDGEFWIGDPVPLGIYTLKISAEYQGATYSQDFEFAVLKRSS